MTFVATARSRPTWPHMHARRRPAVALCGPLAVLRGPAGQADGPRPPRRLPGPGLHGREIYLPKGVRWKTKRAGSEGLGNTR
eukprot:6102832-Pyramimonas_sp.AAC.1